MKFPLFTLNKSLVARTTIFLMCVAALTISASAQKSRSLSTTWEKLFAPEAVGLNIEQCANGPVDDPNPCNTSTANTGYGRGNLVPSKSHYREGDFVPIRIVITGIDPGTYTITVGYDFTKGGKYATDYLGDYDYTESVDNNPCVGVTGCNPLTGVDTLIPTDPQVTAGFDGTSSTPDDITQISGSMTCFGCTITNISVPTFVSDTSGDSSKFVTITFTTTATNVVIAYGSHISTRQDWGMLNSAINISGSPYHNYIQGTTIPDTNQGNRDLQLSADAVIFPSRVTVIKAVSTLGAPPGTTSTFEFDFTSSANTGLGAFTLVDNQVGNGGGGTASVATGNLFFFGAANPITITEANYQPFWTLAGLVCVNDATNLPHAGSDENLGSRTATIVLAEGDFVTCTFSNTQLAPTAAPASVSGRVVDSFGMGIYNARLVITDVQTGTSWRAVTNPFGYYTIEGPEVGNFYMLSVAHKRYTFADDTRTFSLNEDLAGMDFIANP